MITMESLSFYIVICILAPLIGAFTILFLFFFEKQFESLENQTRQLALEKELQTTKYDILSQKIQPHFFFNTLNIILSLARLERKNELIHSIETLAKFMKRKYTSDHSLATVEEEMNYTNYYLDIQKLRFTKRLFIDIEIEEQLSEALIPAYVIQTLTENCFKHSFEKYSGEAHLKIDMTLQTDTVFLSVWNNKMSGSTEYMSEENVEVESTGIGLSNIRERLLLLYPLGNPSLTLLDDHYGTTVIMKWPLHFE